MAMPARAPRCDSQPVPDIHIDQLHRAIVEHGMAGRAGIERIVEVGEAAEHAEPVGGGAAPQYPRDALGYLEQQRLCLRVINDDPIKITG